MHPILAHPSGPGKYAVAWLGVGLALSALASGVVQIPLLSAVVLTLPLIVVFGFVCLATYYVSSALPLKGPAVWRSVLKLISAAILSSSLWLLLGRGWVLLVQAFTTAPPFDRLDVAYNRELPLLFGFGILLFLLASAMHYVFIAFAQSREAETRALRLQVLASDAELRALRSQITPHFLFNSLNSISALTSLDPAGARRMCLLLGDFLRGTLKLSSQERIPLAQELTLIDQFLAIEQVRFGARLRVESTIAPEATDSLIPPLLLQPLVENAVAHGIADLIDGGTVHIAAWIDGQRLCVAIDNPRDVDGSRRAGAGVGLANVRKRLDAAYGSAATCDVQVEPTRFQVQVSLPHTLTSGRLVAEAGSAAESGSEVTA